MKHIGDLNFQNLGQLLKQGSDLNFGISTSPDKNSLNTDAISGEICITLDNCDIYVFQSNISDWRKFYDVQVTRAVQNITEGILLHRNDSGKRIIIKDIDVNLSFILPTCEPGITFDFINRSNIPVYISVNDYNTESIDNNIKLIKITPNSFITILSVNTNIWTLQYSNGSYITYNTQQLYGNRGLILAGNPGLKSIEYINISTPSNASFFGNLRTNSWWLSGACSNSILNKGLAGNTPYDVQFDYFDILTLSSCTSIMDLTYGTSYWCGLLSNGLGNRGIVFDGWTSDAIRYFNISNPISSEFFGNVIYNKAYWCNGTSNGINNRGLLVGGSSNYYYMEYISISTTGNSTLFGYSSMNGETYSTSNTMLNRAILVASNQIKYINILTTSNALSFGSFSSYRYRPSSLSNGVGNRAVICGGYYNNVQVNIMDYITITNIGNAIDFGDLIQSREYSGATSNS